MKSLRTVISAAALTALIAPVATAATVLIDDYSTQQLVEDTPTIGNVNTSTSAIGILSADRTLSVSTSPDATGGSTLESTGPTGNPLTENVLNFSNNAGPAGQFGIASVIYDFSGAPSGFVDLADGGTNDKFFFEVLFADLTGTVLSTTVNSTSGSDTFVEVLDATFDPFTRFSEFSGVDFAEVQSLTFNFDASQVQAFDGVLGSISAVPLPASALLLLGGLGGFAGMSASAKRRRRKA